MRLKHELSDNTLEWLRDGQYTAATLGVGGAVIAIPGGVGEVAAGKYFEGFLFIIGGVAAGLAGMKYGEGYAPIQAYKNNKTAGLRWYADVLAFQAMRPPQPEIIPQQAADENLPTAA